MRKRFLSMLLAWVMVLTMIPMTVFATESDNVYISVSYDDKYTNDKEGNPIAYIPVSFETLSGIDLKEYGSRWRSDRGV